MISFAERREQKRYCGVGLHGNILNSNDLEVLNISIHGAAIETVRRVELNRDYTIRVQRHESSLQIRARVVWAMLVSKEGPDRRIIPLYRAGVRFQQVSDQQANFIRNCIASAETKLQESGSSRITYCF
jgi:hypothetical protein